MPRSTKLPEGQIWCLDPGPLRPLVDQFTGHLASLGHTALTVRGYGDAPATSRFGSSDRALPSPTSTAAPAQASPAIIASAPAFGAATAFRRSMPVAPTASCGSCRSAGSSKG